MTSSKIKTSLSIDRELIRWMDGQISEKRFATRTHAVEFALQNLINEERKRSH